MGLGFRGRLLLKHPHLGVALKDLLAVGRVGKISREVMSRVVAGHVQAPLPERALADVIDPALKGDMDGSAVFTVRGRQFFQGNFFVVFGHDRYGPP